jgi:hypothetical protein
MTKSVIYIKGLIAILLFTGCEKNTFTATQRTTPTDQAFVKVAFVSGYSTSTNSPAQVYFNGERLTSNITAPTAYPGGAINPGTSATSDYLAVNPGQTKLEFIVPVTGTANPIRKLFEVTATFEQNRRQTLFVTDTATKVTSFLLYDDATAPDSAFYKLRIVNAMPNVTSIDVYKGANATVAALFKGDIKFASGTEFFDVALGSDSFFVRPTGAAPTTTPIARRGGFTLSSQRIYTMLARGYTGLPSTEPSTSARLPTLSLITNQ